MFDPSDIVFLRRYSVVDDDRFLVGDSLGRLHILGIERFGPGNTISSLVVQDLGQVRFDYYA